MTTTNDFSVSGPGSFAIASNWTLDAVPDRTEDAVINSANGDAFINGTQETVNGIGTGITDAVRVENDAALTLVNGTDTLGNFGSIVVNLESQLAIDGGTVDNAATIELAGFNVSGFAAFMAIEGQVTLDGGGQVEMTIGGGPTVNFISAPGGSTSFLNVDNTISGDGTLGEGLKMTNGSAGLIETNNSTSGSGGHMQIEGSAGNGSFINDGTMRVDPTGEFTFGLDSFSATINNENQIILDPDLRTATLAIAGNVTIQATFGTTGRIEMEGPGYSGNQIVSDGAPATLTLSGQSLDGAGSVGDANLTLNLLNSTIAADVANEPLILYTGSNTITNNVSTLAAFSGDLVIESPVDNIGTIEVNGGNGIVDLFAAETGSGAIDVGGGTLDVHAAVAGNIAFTSGGATIIVELGANLEGVISGAGATDAIDVRSVNFVSGVQAIWQQNGTTGTLSLVNNGSTLASFTLSGQYSSANFAAFSDGNSGTSIQVENPPPSGGTTADLIMRDGNSGDYEVYDLGSNAIQGAAELGQVGLQWQVTGVGGFNGSDTSDMILREDSGTLAGSFEVYDISNNNITNSAAMGQVGMEWQVSGFGDLSSRPGETDMLMRNSNTGAFEIYDISNNQITSAASMGQVGLEWSVAGFGDFSTQANETDMLMRNTNTGVFEVYDVSNNQITSAGPMGQVGLEWSIAGFGDFSGNANETDMLMRNNNTGAFEIYGIRNNTITSAAPMGQVGLEWQIAGFGPINGAGASDMLMRDTNNGAFEVYDISNNQITAAAPMGQVGMEWSVAGIAADPPGSANAQLAQAMASFASGAGAPDKSAPLGQLAAQSNVSGLLTVPGAGAHSA